MHAGAAVVTARALFAAGLLILAAGAARAAEFTVLVYNVENLFDADGRAAFEDYLPVSAERPGGYSPRKLLTKLEAVATVLSRFNEGRGPEIILFQEIEVDESPDSGMGDPRTFLERNRGVKAADLLSAPSLAPAYAGWPSEAWLLKHLADRGIGPYSIVVGETRPDPMGRTIAQKNVTFSRFPVVASRTIQTEGARAIVEVTVNVDGHRLTLFNNHWKSGASDPESEPIRRGNARTLRARIDEILATDRMADLVVGGDLNTYYNSDRLTRELRPTALHAFLRSQGNELALRQAGGPDLYNLWFELPPDQRGSDTYRGHWGTLMHLLVSRGLYDLNGVQYVDNSFRVAAFKGLNADAVLGTPIRWSPAGETGGGFSDHFPLFARFRTVSDGRRDRWIALTAPGSENTSSATGLAVDNAPDVDFSKAIATSSLPAGTNLQTAEFTGKLMEVRGKVIGENPFVVEVNGQQFRFWAPDRDFRIEVYNKYEPGDAIHAYAVIGQYRGQWQIEIRDRSWLR